MLESELERKCRVFAESNGCHLVKIQGVRGWPDRLLLIPGGLAVFMEFKREGLVPRPLQSYILEDLQKMGFMAGVIDTFLEFQKLLPVLKVLSGSRIPIKHEGLNGC